LQLAKIVENCVIFKTYAGFVGLKKLRIVCNIRYIL
ncbi:MAG: hypothetical protein ACJAVF_001908, partial [Paraglaciecola sp.]